MHGLDRWDLDEPAGALPYLHLYYLASPPTAESANEMPRGLSAAEEPVFRQVIGDLFALEVELGGELPPVARGRLQLNGQAGVHML